MRQFWKRIDLLKKLEAQNKGGKAYFLLDGPPYANDAPHIGHIRNTIYKDLYLRFAQLQGKDVLFQPGFDTHGLPIENKVEKKLKLKSKKDVEKIGIRTFMNACRENATMNKDVWMETYELLGSWYAWKEPYLTYDNSYIESAWWGFKQIWEKGLVYEGTRPVHWCPQCQTSLAGYETTDSYKNVSDPSVIVKFKVKGKEDEFLLVYTTTPWTLPANVAIAVHPQKTYVRAKTKEGVLILAKRRLELLDEMGLAYEVLETFPGSELEGVAYEPLLDVPCQRRLADDPKALRVVMSLRLLKQRVASKVGTKKRVASKDLFEDFVTDEEGTGLVHTAPGHGKTDNEVGKHYGLPELSPVDEEGKLTADAAPFNGTFVKDADHDIAEHLHKEKKLLKYERIEHSYPLCWRCKSPLIFRLSRQWFIKIDPLKDAMLSSNDRVCWQPSFAKERFASWVANAEDWNFSRQRFWGIPLPIWKSEDGEEVVVVGSREELEALAKKPLPAHFDLHAASEVVLRSRKTGKELRRTSEIFDVWFDSGVAPFASLGFPFKGKVCFEKHYPVDRVNESQDQIRGWFYSLMFCGMAVFGKAPYKTVSMPGWVLDAKGEKMSKSVGNVVSAKDVLKRLGADPVRFYYCWNVAPYQVERFNEEIITGEVFKFFSIFWNLHELVLGKEREEKVRLPEVKPQALEDEWVLSRLKTVTKLVVEGIEAFELHQAGRALFDFVVNDLSRGYVQFVRERLEHEAQPLSILAACLQRVCVLLAPICPHMSEKVYQDLARVLPAKESVHLERYPAAGPGGDSAVERLFAVGQSVLQAGLACRDEAKRGVRWPCKELVVMSEREEVKSAVETLSPLLQRQLNVKSVVVRNVPLRVSFKPNYRELGKAFGEQTGDVLTLLKKEEAKVVQALEKAGLGIGSAKKEGAERDGPAGSGVLFSLGGFAFRQEFFEIELVPPGGFVLAKMDDGVVLLNVEEDPELEAEGFAREVVRRVQALRKREGLSREHKIVLTVVTSACGELSSWKEYLQKKVGAERLELLDRPPRGFAPLERFAIKGRDVAVSFDRL
ncbi:isoleucine--tRNA ligase [Candidatus Woesearchaeota archaeon]|nr:MAG: isoleucine--tRNA ligase [Candidatus Woesearchaeota archaeon]